MLERRIVSEGEKEKRKKERKKERKKLETSTIIKKFAVSTNFTSRLYTRNNCESELIIKASYMICRAYRLVKALEQLTDGLIPLFQERINQGPVRTVSL